MPGDVAVRIVQPVAGLDESKTEGTSVQRECDRCGQPVWYNTEQKNPHPSLPEYLMCVECGLADPRYRPKILDMFTAAREAHLWAERK